VKQSIILNHAIKCNKERAYSYFIDFEKFGKIHPVIHTVTQIEPQTGNSKGKYFIKESIVLFGFIKMNPEYTAEVFEVEQGNKIQYTSQVKPGVFLEINLEFSDWENGFGTIIKEEVTVTANPIICSILLKQIKKIHLDLIKNLEIDISE